MRAFKRHLFCAVILFGQAVWAQESTSEAPVQPASEVQPPTVLPNVQPALPLPELDLALAKERLHKIYGDFNLKGLGDWTVSHHGQTQVWKLDREAWICPKEPLAPCADWMPTVFKWWILNKGWLESWNPEGRDGFDVVKGRTQPVVKENAGTSSEASNAEDDTVEKLPAEFQGTRFASELWTWKSTSDTRARLYISLRNQWIDRIDYGDTQEYLEWSLKAGKIFPELVRVVMVRGDERVSFSRALK